MPIFFVAACLCYNVPVHANAFALNTSSFKWFVPSYSPGKVGGDDCDVTCLFLSQSLLLYND